MSGGGLLLLILAGGAAVPAVAFGAARWLVHLGSGPTPARRQAPAAMPTRPPVLWVPARVDRKELPR